MSTTTKTSRGKPVTLAKSASGETVAPRAEAKSPVKSPVKSQAKSQVKSQAKPQLKSENETIAQKSAEAAKEAETLKPAAPHSETARPVASTADPHFAAKWNDLVKAQSDAAMAWWQDAKDARTFADALAVNARHSRVQLELAADQAREMAAYFQKTFEGNADRLRAMLTPGEH